MIWYRVDVPAGQRGAGFVCGIVTTDDGLVVQVAPILRWALGLDIDVVANWVLAKDGEIEPLYPPPTPMIFSGGKLRLIGRG